MRFSENAAAKNGLTPQQYQALLAIRAAPDARLHVGELAEQLLIRPNSATELVNRLESLGFVTRRTAENDRRQILIELTRIAKEILAALASIHRLELQRLGPLLSDLLTRL